MTILNTFSSIESNIILLHNTAIVLTSGKLSLLKRIQEEFGPEKKEFVPYYVAM